MRWGIPPDVLIMGRHGGARSCHPQVALACALSVLSVSAHKTENESKMKIRLTTDDELQTQEKNQAGNIAILERQIAMLRDRLDLALLANHMAANVPSDQQPDQVGAC